MPSANRSTAYGRLRLIPTRRLCVTLDTSNLYSYRLWNPAGEYTIVIDGVTFVGKHVPVARAQLEITAAK